MAPGLALESLAALRRGSLVLDPMTGSGTVIREATDLGHQAIGFDMDPLAVLMSSVWTTPVEDGDIGRALEELIKRADSTSACCSLPWIDDDGETKKFVEFWFGGPQAETLTRLAATLNEMVSEASSADRLAAIDVLRLNLSRIIVTKEKAASLARDTSHSRPHKVSETSDYDVMTGYQRSLVAVRRRLKEAPPMRKAAVSLGDVRVMGEVETGTVDAVVTSPPYLNAIDYLRGHRMALVWLGWSIPHLRKIRSASIGAERSLAGADLRAGESCIVEAMIGEAALSSRCLGMIQRYAQDLNSMLVQIARVLKKDGHATFVVGNSCLKGVFIRNADGVAAAAGRLGMRETSRVERDLPQASRYLPVTGEALAKRMRTETVMTFAHA